MDDIKRPERAKHDENLNVQGVPRNMTEIYLWHLVLNLLSHVWFWNNHHILTWHFQNVVCISCAVNISGDIKNFAQISILLNKTKVVEI